MDNIGRHPPKLPLLPRAVKATAAIAIVIGILLVAGKTTFFNEG